MTKKVHGVNELSQMKYVAYPCVKGISTCVLWTNLAVHLLVHYTRVNTEFSQVDGI